MAIVAVMAIGGVMVHVVGIITVAVITVLTAAASTAVIIMAIMATMALVSGLVLDGDIRILAFTWGLYHLDVIIFIGTPIHIITTRVPSTGHTMADTKL